MLPAVQSPPVPSVMEQCVYLPLQGRPDMCAGECGAAQAGELDKQTPLGLGRYGCRFVTVRNAQVNRQPLWPSPFCTTPLQVSDGRVTDGGTCVPVAENAFTRALLPTGTPRPASVSFPTTYPPTCPQASPATKGGSRRRRTAGQPVCAPAPGN